MPKLLEGLVVLDFTRVLAGPFMTMVLSDLGARVIKVELPGKGDEAREVGPFVNGQSVYFASVNRGKESITLDLRHPKAKEVVAGLVLHVDVVTENFRPGTMIRYGLSYEALSQWNPRIVYASLSGFGQTGPYASLGAYDVIIQAMGGIMSVTGPEGGEPTRAGISIGDLIPSLFCTVAILAGLHRREVTGQGCYIDLSMMDALVAVMENAMARYWATGEDPKPLGNRHPMITPFASYTSADGYIVVGAGNDAFFERLCQVLGIPEGAQDPRFASNGLRTEHAGELTEILNQRLRTKTTQEWLPLLQAQGIPCAKVNSMADIVADEHAKFRHMLVEIDQPGMGRMRVPNCPIKAPGYDHSATRPAPTVGQHTDNVLKEFLRLSEAQIAELRAEGVI